MNSARHETEIRIEREISAPPERVDRAGLVPDERIAFRWGFFGPDGIEGQLSAAVTDEQALPMGGIR